MARLLTQTLTLTRSTTSSLVPLRGLSTKVEATEIDLTEDDAAAPVELVGIRRLEDAIHGVMVRRATPDWLPFVPGGSFWVPPLRRPHGVAELVGRIAAAAAAGGDGEGDSTEEAVAPMTEEEMLSFTTVRGWPSAAYFVEGKSPHPMKGSRKDATQTDDEES